MIKRQLWIVYLVVALVFTMMPFTGQVEMVSAANIASGTSGTCEWVIDGDGNLTVEIIMAVEEEFDLEIPDVDAEKFRTVRDMVEYVEARQQNE